MSRSYSSFADLIREVIAKSGGSSDQPIMVLINPKDAADERLESITDETGTYYLVEGVRVESYAGCPVGVVGACESAQADRLRASMDAGQLDHYGEMAESLTQAMYDDSFDDDTMTPDDLWNLSERNKPRVLN